MKNNNEQNTTNRFSRFVSDLLVLPIWIKQLLYIYLKYVLEDELTPQYLSMYDIEDIFQLHKCSLTYKGKKELETKSMNFKDDYYKFLKDSLDGLTIAETTIKNAWNLFEVANSFVISIENEHIAIPQSLKLVELARYISGKTRIGEYFLRTNQISVQQLENALEQQEKIKRATNEQVGTATVLVNMGFVNESEIKAVLRYKEESRKRFLFSDIGLSDTIISEDAAVLKETNEKLLKENNLLKTQIRKMLNFRG